MSYYKLKEGFQEMRKLLLVMVSLVFLLSSTACSSNKYTTNENISFISATQLSDREKMFLSVCTNDYFVFDFSVSDKYKWIEVWIDRYEFGKKVTSNGKLLTGLSESSDGMILATLREQENIKYNWTIATKTGGATATGDFNQEYKSTENYSFAKTWQTIHTKKIIKDDNEITLASICYKEQKNGTTVSSLTDEFYRSPDENIREILNYNLVYLLKVKFYENNPNN